MRFYALVLASRNGSCWFKSGLRTFRVTLLLDMCSGCRKSMGKMNGIIFASDPEVGDGFPAPFDIKCIRKRRKLVPIPAERTIAVIGSSYSRFCFQSWKWWRVTESWRVYWYQARKLWQEDPPNFDIWFVWRANVDDAARQVTGWMTLGRRFNKKKSRGERKILVLMRKIGRLGKGFCHGMKFDAVQSKTRR